MRSSRQLAGDKQRRITVPMPKSLDELSRVARQSFGAQGSHRMYHGGNTHLHSPAQVLNLKHNDVVVVDWDSAKPVPMPLPSTTMRAHYVPHDHQVEMPYLPPSYQPNTEPFHGNTSYSIDYVKHPLPELERRKHEPWRPNAAQTGESMYSTHYPWKSTTPRSLLRRPEIPKHHVPFEGTTSYNVDYVEHDPRPRTAAFPERTNLADGYRPFEGVTTYKQDYQRQEGARMTPMRPYVPPRESAPFEGRSEYRERYMKMNTDAEMLHIEPALNKRFEPPPSSVGSGAGHMSGPGHRPSSAPVGASRRRRR